MWEFGKEIFGYTSSRPGVYILLLNVLNMHPCDDSSRGNDVPPSVGLGCDNPTGVNDGVNDRPYI